MRGIHEIPVRLNPMMRPQAIGFVPRRWDLRTTISLSFRRALEGALDGAEFAFRKYNAAGNVPKELPSPQSAARDHDAEVVHWVGLTVALRSSPVLHPEEESAWVLAVNSNTVAVPG